MQSINNSYKQLNDIIEQKKIYPVYQPIVSLENGRIIGYEALSRIDSTDCEMNIQQLFETAANYGITWELEKICRKKALKQAVRKPEKTFLFVNVNPNIIHDTTFRKGFTENILNKQKLLPEEIIFEITESSDIESMEIFLESIEHYRSQNFKIAVDDYGAKYSGLNRVCSFRPEYLKIDMDLIRNIDTDSMKKSAVKSIVSFCRESRISTIAEGIETESELRMVMSLGVDFGQGFYLAKPKKDFEEIDYAHVLQIKSLRNQLVPKYSPTMFGKISEICTDALTVKKGTSSIEIYNKMLNNTNLTEAFVLNDDKSVYGILTRSHVLEAYSGLYGYNLGRRLKVDQIVNSHMLFVDGDMSVDAVAELAMQRDISNIYDAIAVGTNNKFIGSVSIKDLLLVSVKIQVSRATEANPLTGLPGNNTIHEKILETISKSTPWSIIYIDLDNFKAYNDAYGFANGDMMIKAVADTLSDCTDGNDFIGHVGGDDFVIITETHNIEDMCKKICDNFTNSIQHLYSREDWERGYIVSCNRSGFVENFPIATLSIASVTNRNGNNTDVNELSAAIAVAKKKSKNIKGNSIVIN